MMAHPSRVGHTLKIQGIPLKLEVDYTTAEFGLHIHSAVPITDGMRRSILKYLKTEGFFDKPDGTSCDGFSQQTDD